MTDRIPIDTIVYHRETDRLMYVDSYPLLNSVWTGEYVCRWYDDDGYARRGTFKIEEIRTSSHE